ncbi:MAG: helix-hairpin-helix domain-containing protein [Bacteroidaceae bacterium]|nr:helix-hairpin-helix domain-containing protein [Bacteroidaceae bacterium]
MKSNPFKDFFYFIKSDRRAIVALGCVAVFAIGVLVVVDAWKDEDNGTIAKEKVSVEEEKDEERVEVVMREFDPNTVDSMTLIGFGLKAWKVKNFLHYRAAGKVFRSAEEMGKTYGWTEEDVERVRGYVRVGKEYEKKDVKKWKTREKMEEREERQTYTSNKFRTLTKVDVNMADTALLRRVPGIGGKISEAIVAYRKKLGGFYSVEQLRELKIVSPELLEWFEVSSSPDIQRLNINKASFQALNSHPYISYEQTKALLQYIRLYGKVKDEQALLETGLFTKEEVERLKPYLAFE